jgi:hypothetical protein
MALYELDIVGNYFNHAYIVEFTVI